MIKTTATSASVAAYVDELHERLHEALRHAAQDLERLRAARRAEFVEIFARHPETSPEREAALVVALTAMMRPIVDRIEGAMAVPKAH